MCKFKQRINKKDVGGRTGDKGGRKEREEKTDRLTDRQKGRESWLSREGEGWMDARSQGFIPEPIGLQTLAQQDVETLTHTHTHTPEYITFNTGQTEITKRISLNKKSKITAVVF